MTISVSDSAQVRPWALRFFASVDIIGSTALKSFTAQPQAPEWAFWIREFYRDFPTVLATEYSRLPSCLRDRLPSERRLALWKRVGDELQFQSELAHHTESLAHVLAFKGAVSSYSALWRGKTGGAMKATAWLAGFPVTNASFEANEAGSAYGLDFVGPSIDLGFRLTHLADARRFIISADLALMVIDAQETVERTESPDCHLVFEGRRELAGVLGGLAYPVCWICMQDLRPTSEEQLLSFAPTSQHSILAGFLRRFIDDTSGLRRPFIAADEHPVYGAIDQELEVRRQELAALEAKWAQEGEAGREPRGDARKVDLKPPDEAM